MLHIALVIITVHSFVDLVKYVFTIPGVILEIAPLQFPRTCPHTSFITRSTRNKLWVFIHSSLLSLLSKEALDRILAQSVTQE